MDAIHFAGQERRAGLQKISKVRRSGTISPNFLYPLLVLFIAVLLSHHTHMYLYPLRRAHQMSKSIPPTFTAFYYCFAQLKWNNIFSFSLKLANFVSKVIKFHLVKVNLHVMAFQLSLIFYTYGDHTLEVLVAEEGKEEQVDPIFSLKDWDMIERWEQNQACILYFSLSPSYDKSLNIDLNCIQLILLITDILTYCRIEHHRGGANFR